MHDSLDVTHKTFSIPRLDSVFRPSALLSAMAAHDELKVAFANFDKDNAGFLSRDQVSCPPTVTLKCR